MHDQVAVRSAILEAINDIVRTPNHVDYVALCDFESPIERFILISCTSAAGSFSTESRDINEDLVKKIVQHEVAAYEDNPFHGYKHSINDHNTVAYVPLGYEGKAYFMLYMSSEGRKGKTREQILQFEGEFEDVVGETAHDLLPAIRGYFKSMNGGSMEPPEKNMLEKLMRNKRS